MHLMRAVPVLLSAIMSAHQATAAPATGPSPDPFKPTNTSNLAAVLASTPQLQELNSYLVKDVCALEQYQTADKVTVFAAINDAWAAFRKTPLGPALDNTTLVHAALQYVVVNGVYDAKALQKAAPTFLTTKLFDPGFSQVSGGQVVKIVKGEKDDLVAVQGLNSRSTLIHPDVFFDGGVVHIMDNLFVFPQDLAATAAALGPLLSTLSYLLSIVQPPQPSPLSLYDVTIFVPAAKYLDELKADCGKGNAKHCCLDHYTVSGNVSYSTDLTDGLTLETRDDKKLRITTDKDATYVNGKLILQSDTLVSNGVVHIIDGIL